MSVGDRIAMRRDAFTLIELLVCMAIVSVLAGILAGVLGAAKHRGQVAADIETLRQLGLAANLYREDEGADWPTGCQELVYAGRVPRELCSGRADPTDRGIANLLIPAQISHRSAPFRSSFVGSEVTNAVSWSRFERSFFPKGVSHVGWLADCSSMRWPVGIESGMPGRGSRYRRLTLEGSVIPRTLIYGFESRAVYLHELFADYPEGTIPLETR